MVLWFPHWSVVASVAATGQSITASSLDAEPVVVVRAGRVVDASGAALADGVEPGLRVREAQGRSPGARILRADEVLESRAFDDVLDVVEQVATGVEVVRPGLCVIPVRGPARFFGGEVEAVRAVVSALQRQSVLAVAAGVRVGVADEVFTAEQAAYTALPSPVVVTEGRSRDFLAPLPIDRLGDSSVVALLQRLGVLTFGQFAVLPVDVVDGRLGASGVRLHRQVRGDEHRVVVPRDRHEDLSLRLHWDEPVTREDHLAFAVRDAVGDLVNTLMQRRLVATTVRVELVADRGGRSDRLWSHPQCFDAPAIVDRVRWQVQSAVRGAGVNDPETGDVPQAGARTGLDGGIIQVTITPERVDEAFRFERALFGVGVEDRVAQGLARVQSIVGHEGVLVAHVVGGRSAHDRRVFVPWGDPPPPTTDDGPWPGRLPSPSPSVVYRQPVSARVVDASGAVVSVDARGALSGEPAVFDVLPEGDRPRRHRVMGWAGPWPVTERWWEAADGRSARVDRFQCVDADNIGWLLVCADGQWWAEARYD